MELLDWHLVRWEIEILFNVLKNGYRVIAMQLEAIERLGRALALFLVVAYRMRTGRNAPDLDAELFFNADKIRGAYSLIDAKPAKPKINEVLRLIARLVGFLDHKGDSEPGPKFI